MPADIARWDLTQPAQCVSQGVPVFDTVRLLALECREQLRAEGRDLLGAAICDRLPQPIESVIAGCSSPSMNASASGAIEEGE